jgi:AcrR family transcriptional regulator
MKTDARVRYTKKVLRDSLIKLLKAKPIQAITVKELCESAEINRATFYTHYSNPYDLLEQIESELFEEMSAKVIKKFTPDTLTSITKLAFDIIADNIELYRVLLSENGNKQFLDRIMRLSRDTTISSWKAMYPHATKNQIEFLFSFIISGSVAVIERWVSIGMKETPVELAEMVTKTAQIWLKKKKKDS